MKKILAFCIMAVLFICSWVGIVIIKKEKGGSQLNEEQVKLEQTIPEEEQYGVLTRSFFPKDNMSEIALIIYLFEQDAEFYYTETMAGSHLYIFETEDGVFNKPTEWSLWFSAGGKLSRASFTLNVSNEVLMCMYKGFFIITEPLVFEHKDKGFTNIVYKTKYSVQSDNGDSSQEQPIAFVIYAAEESTHWSTYLFYEDAAEYDDWCNWQPF